MPEAERLFLEGGDVMGLELRPHLPAFAQLLELLQAGNTRLNLTALRTEPDIVLKHFIDSLTCLRGGHLDGALRAIDLGTGAGFPSLPLAIVRPALHLTPLDSIRKKIAFVTETAAALGLNHVQALVGRAERLGQQAAHRGHYDRVVVRAVAPLPTLVELALPLLNEGGLLIAQKGALGEDELTAGRRAAGEVGGEVVDVDPFALPVLGDERCLVVVRKTRPTPRQYPRRDGVPTAQPLFWRVK